MRGAAGAALPPSPSTRTQSAVSLSVSGASVYPPAAPTPRRDAAFARDRRWPRARRPLRLEAEPRPGRAHGPPGNGGGNMRRAIRIGAFVAMFGAGYLLGATTQPSAEAQVDELRKKAMESAGETGGPLGTAAKLGSTISGLQENVNELQGHIDTLNQIKASLPGG